MTGLYVLYYILHCDRDELSETISFLFLYNDKYKR